MREVQRAQSLGRGEKPICNLCDLPVQPDQAWHESHCPSKPKAFGGTATGIAHAKCNLDHGARFVTPAVAKADRVFKRHVGITGPGLGSHPMRCGRRSAQTKTMCHGVQPRQSQAQRHRDCMRERDFSAPRSPQVEG